MQAAGGSSGRGRAGEGGHEGAARGFGGAPGLSFPPKPGGWGLAHVQPSIPFIPALPLALGGMSDLGAISGALHLDLIVLTPP